VSDLEIILALERRLKNSIDTCEELRAAKTEARSVILRLNRLLHNDGRRSYPDKSDIEAAVAWLNKYGGKP
jgi:hypothetical protein